MGERRPAAMRKSDFTPAFSAAKEAGFDQVSVVMEGSDGRRYLITATCGPDLGKPDLTPFDEWKAGYVTE
tara:strand:+ start:1474 stop:1683 length:210 start_codon:yes stop_codon:yes gene_type:complete